MQNFTIEGTQASASRLNPVHNKFSKTGNGLGTNKRVTGLKTSQRRGVQMSAARLYPLVMQALKNIDAHASGQDGQAQLSQEKPQLSGEGQYFYLNDGNGFAYLVDHGSMKIVHAKRVMSCEPKK